MHFSYIPSTKVNFNVYNYNQQNGRNKGMPMKNHMWPEMGEGGLLLPKRHRTPSFHDLLFIKMEVLMIFF